MTNHFQTIVNGIVGRTGNPTLAATIAALFSELEIEDNETFPNTYIPPQDVEAAIKAIVAANPAHRFNTGQRSKLDSLVSISNKHMAPLTYPPILTEWETVYAAVRSNANGGNQTPAPPPNNNNSNNEKLTKSPINMEAYTMNSASSSALQASELLQQIQNWMAPQHAVAAKIVSITRGLDGHILQEVVAQTGAEEHLNRNLHSAMNALIMKTTLLKNRVPEAATGRELLINVLNTLVPPHEIQRLRNKLGLQLAGTHYSDFDTPEAFLAERNSILRQVRDFGDEVPVETKYVSLLNDIEKTPEFNSVLAQFQDLKPTDGSYKDLENRFLTWARFQPKDPKPTELAVRAAKKAQDDQSDQISELTKQVEALEQRRGGKKTEEKRRTSHFIPPEYYTDEVREEWNDYAKDHHAAGEALKEKFNKEKGWGAEEPATGKGDQKAPNIRGAHRVVARPANDNKDPPLTVFAASKTSAGSPDFDYDAPLVFEY
jgi:hypothetical protein